MEVKSVGGDGMYTFAIVANGNERRRYRVQRRTGAIEEFAPRSGRFGWRKPRFWADSSIRRVLASTEMKLQ